MLLLSLCGCVSEVDTSLTDNAYDEGYNDGYKEGYAEAESFYDDLKSEAYAQGYNAGFDDGFDDGVDVGYQNCLIDYPDKSSRSVQTSDSQVLTLVPSSSSSDRSVPSESSQPVKSSVTVYITETGEKYHSDDCSYLKNSKIPISKDDAISRDYTPCSRCKP